MNIKEIFKAQLPGNPITEETLTRLIDSRIKRGVSISDVEHIQPGDVSLHYMISSKDEAARIEFVWNSELDKLAQFLESLNATFDGYALEGSCVPNFVIT